MVWPTHALTDLLQVFWSEEWWWLLLRGSGCTGRAAYFEYSGFVLQWMPRRETTGLWWTRSHCYLRYWFRWVKWWIRVSEWYSVIPSLQTLSQTHRLGNQPSIIHHINYFVMWNIGDTPTIMCRISCVRPIPVGHKNCSPHSTQLSVSEKSSVCSDYFIREMNLNISAWQLESVI